MGQVVTKQQPRCGYRSAQARALCQLKLVRQLIKTERLGPCWAPLGEGQGHECPVCMENYVKLNHTGCCDQEICTECFMSIIASCEAARCPYCQAEALQVFLPRTSSAHAASRATGRPGAASCAATRAPPRSEPTHRLAAPGSFLCGAECAHRLVSATAAKAGAAPGSSLCQLARSNGPATPGPTAAAALPCNAAEWVAARAAQRQPGSAAGVLLAREPGSSGGSSPAATPVGSPQCRSLLGSPASRSPVGSPLSQSCSSSADTASPSPAVAAAAVSGVTGLASPSGGPALLLNPDGTGQLVLLSREETARRAEQLRQAGLLAAQAEAQAQQAVASYQASTSTDDRRVQAAIARSDAALRRTQPTASPTASPTARGERAWLERLAAADAAVREAVARVDAQRFGAAGSGSSSPPAAP